jgi:hypothetical protein
MPFFFDFLNVDRIVDVESLCFCLCFFPFVSFMNGLQFVSKIYNFTSYNNFTSLLDELLNFYIFKPFCIFFNIFPILMMIRLPTKIRLQMVKKLLMMIRLKPFQNFNISRSLFLVPTAQSSL